MTKQTEIPKAPTLVLDFNTALILVETELSERLSSSPPIIRSLTGHLAGTKGKYIRAYSLLSCSQDREGKISHDAVLLASAVEMLHLATLVHDDVIDNADLRRGEVTLQKKFGKRRAVICGDYLFCLSLQIASEISQRETKLDEGMLPAYMSRICLGELRQSENNRNFDISPIEYFRIISGKTAALFEASFVGGFALSGEDEKVLEQYKKLGHYTGMIFQLTDDCLDYESSREKAKKSVLSDYEQGVITLPLIFAFQNSNKLKAMAVKSELTGSNIWSFVQESGGIAHTHSVIKKYYEKAYNIILSMDISEDKKSKLKSILNRAGSGITLK